jgi:thioredoxin-related protein
MKKKTIIIFTIFISLIIIFVLIFLSFIQKPIEENKQIVVNPNSEIIIFSGEGCEHCVIVEDYISSNNLENKLNINIKETYNNLNNAQELENRLNSCLNPVDFAVPFLWHDRICLVGPEKIIIYLNSIIK